MTLTSTVYKVRFITDSRIMPEERVFRLKAKVWATKGPSTYYLLTLPVNAAKTIKKRFGHTEKGWGSIPVEVKTMGFIWKTSIFTDKRSGSYIMLLKKEAREKNGVKKGDTLSFQLVIR